MGELHLKDLASLCVYFYCCVEGEGCADGWAEGLGEGEGEGCGDGWAEGLGEGEAGGVAAGLVRACW